MPIAGADFIAKLHIALKECYETEYWLELLTRAQLRAAGAAAFPGADLRHPNAASSSPR